MGDCLVAMDILGASAMKQLLLEMNVKFPGGVPTNIEDRNAVINSWDDDESIDGVLDRIDERASHLAKRLEHMIVGYIERQGL